MEKQIQKLTDRIYQEGVERGNAQADVIIAEAKQTAAKIIAQAKANAEAMTENARKKSEELHQNTINELKLYAGQIVEAVKTALTDCITDTITTQAVNKAWEDPKFIQEMALKLVSEWGQKEELVIGTEDAESLRTFFAQKAKDLLDNGVKIEEVNGLKHAFSVAPADGAYKIIFGEEEFKELFKDFLRPALIKLLY